MIAAPAGADDGPPQAAVCVPQGDSGERAVDPLRLVAWAIKTSGLSDQALDTDGDGDTLLAEKQLALADPAYCQRPERRCDAADAAAQQRIHQRLAAFVRTQNGSYRFERIRRPDQLERDEAPYLNQDFEQPDSSFQVGETLAVPARYVRVVCLDRPAVPVARRATPPTPAAKPAPPPTQVAQRNQPVAKQDAPQPVAGQEPPPTPAAKPAPPPTQVAKQDGAPAADGAPGGLPIRTGFRLTGELADLGKDRSNLRAIAPAQFSISGNLKEKQTDYFVDLFAGYEIDLGRQDRSYFSAIPFFQFERRFNGTQTDIDNIGGGAKFLMATVSENLGRDELAISPYYLTDTKGDRQILTTQARFTPSLPQRYGVPIGWSRKLAGLLWQIDFDGLLEAGHVFRARDTAGPLDRGDFLRTGGTLSLSVQGARGTLLERLNLDLANKYLYGITGPLRHFNRFDATLSYLLPGSDRYRLGVTYTIGRADDTLQYQDFWSTVLGVRF